MQADDNIPETLNGHKPTARAGREYHRMRLDEIIAKLDDLIVGADYYLDTLQFYSPYPWKPITDDDVATLNDLAGSAKFPVEDDDPYRLNRQSLLVHQPSPEAIHYIEERFPYPSHQIVRSDIAIDFYTRTKADADIVRDLLGRKVIMPWHAKRVTYLYTGETYYFATSGWQRRNIVIYSRDIGKLRDQPNAHLELRYFSAQVCKSYGFERAADVFDWTLQPHLHRSAGLAVIDWSKERLVAAQAREVQQDYVRRYRTVDLSSGVRAFKRFKSAAITGGGPIPEWGERLEEFGVQRCLDVLPFLKARAVVKRPIYILLMSKLRQNSIYLIPVERSFLRKHQNITPSAATAA